MRKLLFGFGATMMLTALVFVSSCKKEETGPTRTITQLAQDNGDFSILVAALTRSDLPANYADVLSGAGPFTVFAPTNAAFQALLTELNVSELGDIPAATLDAVLRYHVVSGKVMSNQLTEGQTVATLNGATFTVSLAGGAKITDANNRVANISTVDIEATNGVIHAIDKVILP